MYSFYALSGSLAARCAAAAVGTLIVTFLLVAPGISSGAAASASPADAILAVTPNLAGKDAALDAAQSAIITAPEFITLATGAIA